MLPKNLDTRHDVSWCKSQHVPSFILDERWVRNRPFDGIAALRWLMGTNQQRDFRPGAKDILDNPFMRLACFFSQWFETKRITHALDHG
jgi:hypothetical protein